MSEQNPYDFLGVDRDPLTARAFTIAERYPSSEIGIDYAAFEKHMDLNEFGDYVVQSFANVPNELVNYARSRHISLNDLSEIDAIDPEVTDLYIPPDDSDPAIEALMDKNLSAFSTEDYALLWEKLSGRLKKENELAITYVLFAHALIERTDCFAKFAEPRPGERLLVRMDPEAALEVVRLAAEHPKFAEIIGRAVDMNRRTLTDEPG